jgi:hypothetical protein
MKRNAPELGAKDLITNFQMLEDDDDSFSK